MQWMRLARPLAAGVVLGVFAGALGCYDSSLAPDGGGLWIKSVLRPSSSLEAGCYDFPPADPTHIDQVTTRVRFAPGDTAVDFVRRDVDGVECRLADLLATRPVVLIFGAFS